MIQRQSNISAYYTEHCYPITCHYTWIYLIIFKLDTIKFHVLAYLRLLNKFLMLQDFERISRKPLVVVAYINTCSPQTKSYDIMHALCICVAAYIQDNQ